MPMPMQHSNSYSTPFISPVLCSGRWWERSPNVHEVGPALQQHYYCDANVDADKGMFVYMLARSRGLSESKCALAIGMARSVVYSVGAQDRGQG